MKMIKSLAILSLSLVLLGLTGCPSPPPTSTTPGTTAPTVTTTQPPTVTPTETVAGPNNTISISARGLKYSLNKITVKTGAEITVNFKNDDGITLHNFSVYELLPGGQARPIFNGTTIAGGASIVYKFTAPTDSTKKYFFNCDLHPDVMFGDFVVV
jgi:plastocyanin